MISAISLKNISASDFQEHPLMRFFFQMEITHFNWFSLSLIWCRRNSSYQTFMWQNRKLVYYISLWCRDTKWKISPQNSICFPLIHTFMSQFGWVHFVSYFNQVAQCGSTIMSQAKHYSRKENANFQFTWRQEDFTLSSWYMQIIFSGFPCRTNRINCKVYKPFCGCRFSYICLDFELQKSIVDIWIVRKERYQKGVFCSNINQSICLPWKYSFDFHFFKGALLCFFGFYFL